MAPSPSGKGRVGEGGDGRVQTLATISHAQGEAVSDFYNGTACDNALSLTIRTVNKTKISDTNYYLHLKINK